jgi:hypothetical protein
MKLSYTPAERQQQLIAIAKAHPEGYVKANGSAVIADCVALVKSGVFVRLSYFVFCLAE